MKAIFGLQKTIDMQDLNSTSNKIFKSEEPKLFPKEKSFTVYEKEHDEFTVYTEESNNDFDEYYQLFDIECRFR